MYIDLISHNDFPGLSLPPPAGLDSCADAMHAVYYYIGKYAGRINGIAGSRGFEARQRLLYMLIQFVFRWRELALPVGALEAEVPALIAWVEDEDDPCRRTAPIR